MCTLGYNLSPSCCWCMVKWSLLGWLIGKGWLDDELPGAELLLPSIALDGWKERASKDKARRVSRHFPEERVFWNKIENSIRVMKKKSKSLKFDVTYLSSEITIAISAFQFLQYIVLRVLWAYLRWFEIRKFFVREQRLKII